VLVIDGSADLTRAVFGGIMRAMALKAGIVGVVINGALRDLDEWQTGELPAYAIGGVHRGPSTDGGGEINVPISCAGMLVCPWRPDDWRWRRRGCRLAQRTAGIADPLP
jgi:regulator of RNase E activity RraA